MSRRSKIGSDLTMTSTVRRRLLFAALGLPIAPAWACGKRTLQQTAGPFFSPNSPKRVSLVDSRTKTEKLIISGQVLAERCTPVPGALLDFWHCDETGEYDNAGFRYRGHQFADAQGRYRLETIFPGVYPGRTRHIHVRVQAPGGRLLTTQLYFPGEPGNRRDGIYRPELEVKLERRDAARLAAFDFVVEAA